MVRSLRSTKSAEHQKAPHAWRAALTATLAVAGMLYAGGRSAIVGSSAASAIFGIGSVSGAPRIVAEAGVLPTSSLVSLDQFAEVMDRTVFSLGIPSVQTHVALQQAAERLAEVNELERNGALTAAVLRELLERHQRLVARADARIMGRLVSGRPSPSLTLLLVRERLAAASSLEELLVEVGETLDTLPPESGGGGEGDDQSTRAVLANSIEDLANVEQSVLPSGLGVEVLPPEAVRLLAADRIEQLKRVRDRCSSDIDSGYGGLACPRDAREAARTTVQVTAVLAAAQAQYDAGSFVEARMTANEAWRLSRQGR